MGETVSWSLSAGAPGGALSASGSFPADSVTLASVTIDAAANKTLTFQLEDVTKILFLSIKSSLYDGKIKVIAAGAGAKEIKLTGPLTLFGEAVALLGASLDTLKITNSDAAKAVDVEVLIAAKLV
jgi:hypothetical protein